MKTLKLLLVTLLLSFTLSGCIYDAAYVAYASPYVAYAPQYVTVPVVPVTHNYGYYNYGYNYSYYNYGYSNYNYGYYNRSYYNTPYRGNRGHYRRYR